MMRSQSARAGAGMVLAPVLLLLLAAGCNTAPAPREVLASDVASEKSLERFAANANLGVRTLAGIARRLNREVAALRLRREVEDRTEPVDVALPPVEGEEDRQVETRLYVRPEDAQAIAEAYAAALDTIDADVDEVLRGWAEAQLDFADGVDLRASVREWLEREGIGPEHIEAAERAALRAIDEQAGGGR